MKAQSHLRSLEMIQLSRVFTEPKWCV